MNEIISKIAELKKKRDAVILVHNYQRPEVQDIADFLGDSLDLSRKAAETKAKVIVFCGVHFMAETASILCPDKTVLLPDLDAGCPMADMITAKELKELKSRYPGHSVVCYINTSAEIKAESDICCTSSNAVNVVKSLGNKDIIFVPDQNLGDHVSKQTGKKMVLYGGYCAIHCRILSSDLAKARKDHPGAEILVHPECTPDVVKLADKVLSTNGMIKYAKESAKKELVIGTEQGIIYRLEKENPDKKFYPVTEKALCENMKKTKLEKVLWALEDMKNVIRVDANIALRAKSAIDKMLMY